MVRVAKVIGAIVGEGRVTDWADLTDDWRHKIGGMMASQADDGGHSVCLVQPHTVEMLSDVMRVCHQNQWSVLPCGQGTKLDWGGLGQAQVVISTGALDQVVDHWEKDFTIQVEAGLPFSVLRSQLKKTGQFLPIDPFHDDRATLGGIIATADTGSLRHRYGGVRDMLIGVEFVRYDGEIVKAGGRVVKNVAGYDLMKLMTGAYGTLGILSRLTLRLFPLSEQSQTVLLNGEAETIAQMVQQVRRLGLTPNALDIFGGSLFKGRLSEQKSASNVVLVGQFQGIAAGVKEQVSRFVSLGQTLDLTAEILIDDEAFWQQPAQALAEKSDEDSLLCKVGLLPQNIVSFLSLAHDLLPPGWFARMHGGSGLGQICFGVDDEAKTRIEKLRSHCEAHQGFLTVLRAPKPLKPKLDIWGYSGNAMNTMTQIKTQFDPLNLLSPGRFLV